MIIDHDNKIVYVVQPVKLSAIARRIGRGWKSYYVVNNEAAQSVQTIDTPHLQPHDTDVTGPTCKKIGFK